MWIPLCIWISRGGSRSIVYEKNSNSVIGRDRRRFRNYPPCIQESMAVRGKSCVCRSYPQNHCPFKLTSNFPSMGLKVWRDNCQLQVVFEHMEAIFWTQLETGAKKDNCELAEGWEHLGNTRHLSGDLLQLSGSAASKSACLFLHILYSCIFAHRSNISKIYLKSSAFSHSMETKLG